MIRKKKLVANLTMMRLAGLLMIFAFAALGNAQSVAAGECIDVFEKCITETECSITEGEGCEAGTSLCPGEYQCGEDHPNCGGVLASLYCVVSPPVE